MFRLPVVTVNEPVLHVTDTVLRQKSRPIDTNIPEDLELARSVILEMFRALFADPSGVALAAPQLGLLLQIVVISYQDHDSGKRLEFALINPAITEASEEKNEGEEICLSVPNFSSTVPRSTSIVVEGLTQAGEPTRIEASGFFARVLQHEIDHLHGILCIDRAAGSFKYVPDFPERRVQGVQKRLRLT